MAEALEEARAAVDSEAAEASAEAHAEVDSEVLADRTDRTDREGLVGISAREDPIGEATTEVAALEDFLVC